MITQIVIPLTPQGKARHRSRITTPNRPGARSFVATYSDPAQKDHLKELTRALALGWQRPPSAAPIIFGLIAFMPIPKSQTKAFKIAARAGRIRPTSKPDLSNIIKLVEDAANGIIWADDSQIVAFSRAAKFYSDTPKYLLTIEELPYEAEPAKQLGLKLTRAKRDDGRAVQAVARESKAAPNSTPSRGAFRRAAKR